MQHFSVFFFSLLVMVKLPRVVVGPTIPNQCGQNTVHVCCCEGLVEILYTAVGKYNVNARGLTVTKLALM